MVATQKTTRENLTTDRDIKIRKYCTTCQTTQDPDGGERKPNRWICAGCVYRRKHRINTWTHSGKTQGMVE